MNNTILTSKGRLKQKLLPAVYFDTSVLIDYWITEGLEIDIQDNAIQKILDNNEPQNYQIIRELLKSDKRTQKVVDIRKHLLFKEPKLSVVVSPLSLLELMEWNAEAVFKQTAAEAIGTLSIQRKSKKEIGNYLKKLLDLRSIEVKKQKQQKIKEYSTGLEIIMGDTWINPGFALAHGLQGLLQVDIQNFNLSINKSWQEPSAYAYLQLGGADIMHIMFAHHLGCEYIASFDDDFKRVKDIIKKETQMTLLSTPEEILGVL